MAYPFASFGSFLFKRTERPLPESDTRWKREQPSRDQTRPLGSNKDSIVTLALGSATRSYECLFSRDRFDAFVLLVNTTAAFTDWDRPTPGTCSAYLAAVYPVGSVAVSCVDEADKIQTRIRTRVELISQ